MQSTKRPRLLVFNDPHPMRVDKELAAEIGLNESIFFLQIEFLISISRHEQDGRLWTYQSLQDLHDNYFPWWSLATISRIIKALEKRELLIIGNYNKSGFDRTQWFALNEEGINRLQSIRLQPVPIFHFEKSSLQNDEMDSIKMKNRSRQNETTIPETTTETTQSGGVGARNGNAAAVVDALTIETLMACGLDRGQATKSAQIRSFTPDELQRLTLWREQATARKPGAVLWSVLRHGDLPDDLPALPALPESPIFDDEGQIINREAYEREYGNARHVYQR